MNDKIKQFAKQAEEISYSQDGAYTPVYHTNLEKFTELIVRECLSYAKDGDLDFMKFMIKKNFGVEE